MKTLYTWFGVILFSTYVSAPDVTVANAVSVWLFGQTEQTFRVGDIIAVPYISQKCDSDNGVTSIQMALRYNATLLEPVKEADGKIGYLAGDIPGATYSPIVDGTRSSTDNVNRRLTVTASWATPVTDLTGKAILVFKFKAKAAGTANFGMDAVTVNNDPTFLHEGSPSGDLIIKPIQRFWWQIGPFRKL